MAPRHPARAWAFALLLVGGLVSAVAYRTRTGWALTDVEQQENRCRQGLAHACAGLADRYRTGRGVPKDDVQATHYDDRACELGAAASCVQLGERVEQGLGCARSTVRAASAFGRACGLGSSRGCARHGQALLAAARGDDELEKAERVLERACRGDEAQACLALGEHLSTEDVDATRPEQAADHFGNACRLGSAAGCRRLAQALACGRGVLSSDENTREAMNLFWRACAGGDGPACDELVAWVPELVRAELVEAAPPLRAAVASEVYAQMVSGQPDAAVELAGALQTGPEDPLPSLLWACAALETGNLARARALIGDAGTPAARVLAHVVDARSAGTRWPQALFEGWTRAGRPDLRDSMLDQPLRVDGVDPLWCPPDGDEVVPLDDEDAFLRTVVAGRTWRLRPRLLAAALRHLSAKDDVVALAALATLAKLNAPTHRQEARVRRTLADAHPTSAYFGVLPFARDADPPQGLEPREVAALQRALAQPWAAPHRAVFDRLVVAHDGGAPNLSVEPAFRGAVDVTVAAADLRALRVAITTARVPAHERDRLEAALGERLGEGGWIVERAQGADALRSAGARASNDGWLDAGHRTRAAAEKLRQGSAGANGAGTWPIPSYVRAYVSALARDEVATLDALVRADGGAPQ